MHHYNLYVLLAFIAILSIAGAVTAPKKAMLIFRTARWSRHIYYSAMTAAGMFYSLGNSPRSYLFLLYFISGIVLINLLFGASIILNNIYDVKIDSINEKENTLNHSGITQKEYIILYFILLAASIAIALIIDLSSNSNRYTLITALVIHLCAYAYSCPPLRIKKLFPFNTLLIAFSTILAILLGIIIYAPNPFPPLPWKLGLAFFLGIALAFNTKDVNDYEGDKKYGIQTLMTLLGPKKGKPAIGLLALAGYVLVSLITGSVWLVAASLILGIATFCLVALPKKHINEPAIFAMFFIFAAVFMFLKPALF
jgi:4-hydroxybenzoate polyprenyltransferase